MENRSLPGFVFSVAKCTTQRGVWLVLEEGPGVIDVIILCGILKGDPLPSSSRPLGLTVI